MPITYKEEMLKRKYAEIPEELRYRKKKKKIKPSKSKHKHYYASAIFDCGHFTYHSGIKGTRYYIVEYCSICGRINNVTTDNNISNPNLPVFKVEFKDLFAKRIKLEDISIN